MQVSRSKKWASQPALDENGEPLLSKNGKPILRPSYSVLQDRFYKLMCAAGYDDIERGQRGSTEEHLTVTQFKVQQEQQRLEGIQKAQVAATTELAQLDTDKAQTAKEIRQAEAKLDRLAPQVERLEELIRKYLKHPTYQMLNRRDQKGKLKYPKFLRIWNYYISEPHLTTDIWNWKPKVS